MTCNFYQDGKVVQLNDILTITANDTNIVLVNQKQGASTLPLPLSFYNEVDTLLFTVEGND